MLSDEEMVQRRNMHHTASDSAPLSVYFLIANARLEFSISRSKESLLKIPNRERIAILHLRSHALGRKGRRLELAAEASPAFVRALEADECRLLLWRERIPVYNPVHSHPARRLMAADKNSTMWVPVCCGRVMRCNMFRQADGGTYAALVCTLCNKNITLEQESLAAADQFGEGSNILSLIGSPKPPKTERRKSFTETGPDDPTL